MDGRKWLRRIGVSVVGVLVFGLTLWATAALYFDLPFTPLRKPVAVGYMAGLSSALFFYRDRRGFLITVIGFVVVLVWWLSLTPSHTRNWQADVAEIPWAEVDGDRVTIHNVRNCDYRAEFEYTCHWETRTFNLSKLNGLDIALTYWGSPWIAHPIVSFDFGDQGHVAMSIETRDLIGQGYSPIRGFFHQYALTYIASDERDVIRLRTNYRKNEEVYLFRTTAAPPIVRSLFLEYLQRANSLHQRPEWYNALTNNCTTNIAVSVAQARDVRTRLDWRILLNGKMDEMMYERGGLVTEGLPLPALKEQAHINAAARAADDSRDFSILIRKGRVGFTERPSLAMSVPSMAKISGAAIPPE